MAVVEDAFDLGPFEDLRGVLAAEPLLLADDARENFLADDEGIVHQVELPQADVAGVARFAVPGLSEMLDQLPMPAHEARAKLVDRLQGFERSRPRFGGILLGELSPDLRIAAGVEQTALGFQAVAARPPAFLLIVLQRFGHARVDHVPHVGFVDPHPERDRGDDGFDFFLDEGFLVSLAFIVGKARVIGPGFVAQGVEIFAERVHVFAADAVNDSRIAPMPIQHVADLADPVAAAFHAVNQVRPIKRTHEHFGLVEAQVLGDVPANPLGRGGGVGVNPNLRKRQPQNFEGRGIRGENRDPIR